MAFGDSPGEGRADKRTEAAVSLTKKFIKDHHSITDDDFSVLRSVFSVQEISELCAYIAFIGSANRLGVLVGLTQKDVKLCTYSDVD